MWLISSQRIAEALSRTCTGDHTHGSVFNGRSQQVAVYPPKLVAAGKADIAISYQPQLHLQVAAGLPLVRFGTLVATPLNTLTVLADGPIQSLADLKGRKVGFSVAGTGEAALVGVVQLAPAPQEQIVLLIILLGLVELELHLL